MAQEKYVAYVGTYTHENSVGIHIYDVDVTKGYMKERKVVPINNPSDLVVSRNRKFLYSIADEGVEAFKVLKDGDLEPINEQWIGGMRGCYVEVDDENRYLFVGGHHDGRVTMMRLNEDGSIGDIADGIFHQGMGRSIAQRNFIPHVDCVKLTPDQKFPEFDVRVSILGHLQRGGRPSARDRILASRTVWCHHYWCHSGILRQGVAP